MTAEFNWDDARIFLAIARAGTLSGAADKMNMGIATVSRRLDRLEQALNVPLFSRHQSGYRLTDDGEALLGIALIVTEGVLQAVEKHAAIGQLGQGIFLAVQLQLAFELLALAQLPLQALVNAAKFMNPMLQFCLR